jgi:hypothetical protein
MKTYRVNHLRYWDNKRLYQEGELITVPDDREPSKAWVLVEETPAAQPKQETKATAPTVRRGARASDSEPSAA